MVPPRPEFIPVGILVQNSRQLELAHDDQQLLVHDIQQTGRDLEHNPLATPVFRQITMERIPLRGESNQSRTDDSLLVNFSEDSRGRHNALMQLYVGRVATRFQLTPSEDRWDVFSQGDKTANQQMSNTSLVTILANKLTEPRVLDALADSAYFEGMMIPRLLADGLFDKLPDRNKGKQLLYTTDEGVFQGLDTFTQPTGTSFTTPEYLTTVGTHLYIQEKYDIKKKYSTATHQLMTHADYDVNGRKIKKEYGYSIETSKYRYGKSIGHVVISSADGISREQIEKYAELDQNRNEPLSSLRRGLDNLRVSKNLPKIDAA